MSLHLRHWSATARFVRLTTSVFVLGSLLPSAAVADNSLKRLVFKDCPAAITAAQELSGEDRTEFVDYARRVINLETTEANEEDINSRLAAVLRRPMDHGAEPLYNSEVARTLDPREELDARECAGQVLAYLLPDSIAVLPEILRLAGDANQPEELKRSLADSARSIAAKWMGLEDQTLPPGVARRLIALVDQIPPSLAAEVIPAFGGQTIGLIAQELDAAPPSRRGNIFSMLQLKVGSDPEVTALILSLTSSSDVDLRKRTATLIGKLSQFDPKMFVSLLSLAGDTDSSVRSAADQAIGNQISLISDATQIDDPLTIDRLIELVPTSSADTRAAISAQLRRPGQQLSERNRAALSGYLNSADSSLVIESAAILGAAGPLPKTAFTRVVDLLFSNNPAFEETALELLSTQGQRHGEVLAAISRLLKLNTSEPTPERKFDRIIWSARAVTAAKFGAKAKHLAPYFLDALTELAASTSSDREVEAKRVDRITALENAVSSIGASVTGDVVKLLDKGSGPASAAFRILSSSDSLPDSALDELIQRRATAAPTDLPLINQTLAKHLPKNSAPIKKGLKSANPGVALTATELAFSFHLFEDLALDTLLKSLKYATCQQLEVFSQQLDSVPKKNIPAVAAKRAECSAEKKGSSSKEKTSQELVQPSQTLDTEKNEPDQTSAPAGQLSATAVAPTAAVSSASAVSNEAK